MTTPDKMRAIAEAVKALVLSCRSWKREMERSADQLEEVGLDDLQIKEAAEGSAHVAATLGRSADTILALLDRITALEAEREADKARVAVMREALELADCALRGANMNMNVVERKVTAALADQPAKGDE